MALCFTLLNISELTLEDIVHESFMTLRQQIKWKTKEALLTVHSGRRDQSNVSQTDSPLCGILIWESVPLRRTSTFKELLFYAKGYKLYINYVRWQCEKLFCCTEDLTLILRKVLLYWCTCVLVFLTWLLKVHFFRMIITVSVCICLCLFPNSS